MRKYHVMANIPWLTLLFSMHGCSNEPGETHSVAANQVSVECSTLDNPERIVSFSIGNSQSNATHYKIADGPFTVISYQLNYSTNDNDALVLFVEKTLGNKTPCTLDPSDATSFNEGVVYSLLPVLLGRDTIGDATVEHQGIYPVPEGYHLCLDKSGIYLDQTNFAFKPATVVIIKPKTTT